MTGIDGPAGGRLGWRHPRPSPCSDGRAGESGAVSATVSSTGSLVGIPEGTSRTATSHPSAV